QQQDEDEPNKSPLNASANGEEEHPQGSHSDSSSDDENDQRLHGPDQSEGKDPVLADLLRQNSESESDNDEEDVDKTANGGHEAMQGRKKHHAVYEGPANNLAVLMIACWTMRIPLLYRDFTRFIESYELPYLDPVRFLPAEMVSHLTKHAIQALSPAHAPNIVVLHSLTSRLARLLAGKYGVRTPEANAAPILWRVTTSMGGTPTLYRLTKKLSQILSLPLALHHSLVPGLKRVKNRDPESHKFDDVPVELSFMAATIVTLKLVYGLDGNPRSPRDLNDPASGFPTQQNYLDMVKSLNEFDSGKGTSAAEMSDGAIDEYLSFCEHALLPSADVDRDGDKLLTSYFALTRADGLKTATTESTISATARIRLNRISADAERLRPGESYTIYHSRDIAGTMSEETEIVIGRGAKWIGQGRPLPPNVPLNSPNFYLTPMRRLAAVFSSSKRDKSDSSQSSSTNQNPARRSYTNLSLSRKKNIRATLNTADLPASFDSSPPTPQLSAGQSSASSTGSASLQTHDDVPLPYDDQRKVKGKSWIPWLGNRSGTIKRVDSTIPEPAWSLPPASGQPHVASSVPFGMELSSETSESDEEEEEEEEDGDSLDSITRAREVLRLLVQNGLQHQPASSPFVQRQDLPLYPRSCNPSRRLQKQGTTEVVMHKRRLLERLRDRPSLTRREEDSILPFRSKKMPSPALAQEASVNEVAPRKTDKITGFSPGLRQWTNRPPFEERLCIWLPIGETITCQRVSSAFAVAALEFSESLEVMADLPASPSSPTFSVTPPLSPSSGPSASAPELFQSADPPSSSSSTSSSLSAPVSKSAPQLMIPSPLRNETPPSSSAPRPSQGNERTSSSPTSPTSPSAKRGVRFAEDDKEDNIPIGYVMRIKKQKEEKARFLREQKERRHFEEERRRQEEERQERERERAERERERAEWERERKAWEKEKRVIEEERKGRLYAEEFAAARQRAEDSRHGMRQTNSSGSLRDRPERPVQESRRYSRLAYDDAPYAPRSQGHETSSPSPHTSSPASSRPPSIAGPSNGNKHSSSGHSRPPSFYSAHTASSEDVRSKETPMRPSRERSATTPARSGSHTSLLLPPVPALPAMYPTMIPTDMPLLPPTAPFMMNAFPGRPNQSRSSSSSSKRSVPRNGSVESVNYPPSHPRSSSSHTQSPSSSSTRAPTHHRRTSDDSVPRRSNNSSRSSYTQMSLPRGRSQHPAYNAPMIPSPWTAMPMQMGTIPTVMPYYPNHDPRMAQTRRQTTFS
ncbi:hypothetical protein V5O48_015737, partial [Marasmius crinis-equi]